MRISQLAEATGVPAKTIRFYESAGIMPTVSRRANGYREYDDDDLCRLRLVAAHRAIGLGLSESSELAHLDAELANLEAGLDANAPVRAQCIGEGGDGRPAL